MSIAVAENLNPSFQNGYYPFQDEPLYPELWQGCVAAYAPCLGRQGNTLYDLSGFGDHGVITGFTPTTDWVTDNVNGTSVSAMNSTGSSTRVTLKNGSMLRDLDQASISVWCSLSANTSEKGLFGENASSGTVGPRIRISSAKALASVKSGSTWVHSTSSGTLALNTPHLITAVFDKINNQIRMYVDGEVVDSGTYWSGGYSGSVATTLLCDYANGGDFSFRGLIYSCMIHCKSFNHFQHKQLYSIGPLGPYQFREPLPASSGSAGTTTVNPDSITHAVSVESPTLTQDHQVAPQDATHSHSIESPTITQAHTVSPGSAVLAQSIESPTITQQHQIAPTDATHAMEIESPVISTFTGQGGLLLKRRRMVAL